jgi:hypothetical protein
MAIELTAPRIVAQDHSKFHCWACALFSWMTATKRKGNSATPIKDIQDLVNQYSDLANGGISEKGLRDYVAPDFKMKCSAATNDIVEWALEATLKDNGYVLFIYKSSVQVSHTLHVYGCGNGKMKVMDPWEAKLGDKSLSDFNGQSPPLPKMMMWPDGK